MRVWVAAKRAAKMVLVTVSLTLGYLTYIKKCIFTYNYIYVIFNTITYHVTTLMKYYFIIWPVGNFVWILLLYCCMYWVNKHFRFRFRVHVLLVLTCVLLLLTDVQLVWLEVPKCDGYLTLALWWYGLSLLPLVIISKSHQTVQHFPSPVCDLILAVGVDLIGTRCHQFGTDLVVLHQTATHLIQLSHTFRCHFLAWKCQCNHTFRYDILAGKCQCTHTFRYDILAWKCQHNHTFRWHTSQKENKHLWRFREKYEINYACNIILYLLWYDDHNYNIDETF